MNVSTLSLRDLEYLVAVAEHEHFGRAAEACHVSQPALSTQIKKTEDFLNVVLFERTNRRVVITPLGRDIVAQARVVLEEAAKIAVLAQASTAPLSGTLKLGAIASVGPYLMPHVLGALRKRYPKLQFFLKEGVTEQLIRELREGTLDAVIASPTFDALGLTETSLFFEPFVVAMPKGHVLSGKQKLSPTDLNAADMVLLADGHCLKDQTLSVCPSNKRGAIKEFQATSVETLRHLVASGLGYTLLPYLAVEDGPKLKGLLEYRAFASANDGRAVGRAVALYSRARYARGRDLELLAALIRENVPRELVKL